MKFVNPTFLYALAAVIIPIIIHLFNFRKYKTVYFTNVKFLREVKEQTQAKSLLKHLLVLLSRILAIASLVFAFAQPYIPEKDTAINYNTTAASIYVDNSYSMNAVGETGSLIDVAKNYAINIGNTFKATEKYQLLTNDFEGKHQRLVNKDHYNEFIDDINLSPNVKFLSKIIDRQKNALQELDNADKKQFIVSDFQQSNTDIEALSNDTTSTIYLIPTQAENTNNIYIDSCWFESPVRQLNQQEQLHVVITNTSNQIMKDVPLKLYINNQQKAISSFTINPYETIDSTLSYTNIESGLITAKIQLTDYPITYDDDFYLSYEVANHINVLCLFEKDSNKVISSIFANDDYIELKQQNINQLDFSILQQQHLIVLSAAKKISSGLAQELSNFIKNGGSVFIIPSLDMDIENFNQFLNNMNINGFSQKHDTTQLKVGQINLEDIHYNNVFENVPKNMNMPFVRNHFKLGNTFNANKTPLLTLENGEELLIKYPINQGTVYVLTSPIDSKSGNLASHSLLVPTVYKMAINSITPQPLYYTIGNDKIVQLKNTGNFENKLTVKATDEANEFIPEIRKTNTGIALNMHDQIKNAGNYLILNNGEPIAAIGYNYNRKESDLKTYTPDELQQIINDNGLQHIKIINSSEETIANAISNINNGKQLWKYCVILALLFLGIETLLLKYWK